MTTNNDYQSKPKYAQPYTIRLRLQDSTVNVALLERLIEKTHIKEKRIAKYTH